MTADLVVRALAESEARAVFTSLPDPGLVGRPLLGRTYATLAEGGEYRPEWTWVAERAGRVVARAAFWAGPRDTRPFALDWFDFAPGERDAAVRLLREALPALEALPAPLPAPSEPSVPSAPELPAGPRPEYELMLPPGWRELPDVRTAAEERIEAAAAAGYRPLVERYRYRWTPACGLPADPGRLVYEPVPGDDAVLEVLRRIQRGTLDAHARRAVAEAGQDVAAGQERAAREDLDFLRWMPSPRAWWQLAYTADGTLVGLHAPGRNQTDHVVGLIGVVPEQRGHGYAYDLLADCTRRLAAAGADAVVAATDLGNTPMAAAFARAGYPVVQHRYCMV